MAEMRITSGWQPGLIGEVTALHGRFYARHWGFGAFFEAKVAREMAAFFDRYDAAANLVLAAFRDEALLGSVTLDAGEPEVARDGAHLRWFITADQARGTGLGRALMDRAMEHVRALGLEKTYLTSFAGLDAARHLYESFGFVLEAETPAQTWGRQVNEQMFVWRRGFR